MLFKCPVFTVLLVHIFSIAFDTFITLMTKLASTSPAHAFFIGEALL